MGKQIKGVTVFHSGTWNKQAFSEADLDGMVATFNQAGLAGKVPLKFGHDSPLGDGEPALGWVTSLYREGAALKADFSDIPSVVYDSIKAGSYKFTSVELLKNAEYDGVQYPYLLVAVALLGASPPAVSKVSDLQKLAASRALSVSKYEMRATYSSTEAAPLKAKAKRVRIAATDPPNDSTAIEALKKKLQDAETQLGELRARDSRQTYARASAILDEDFRQKTAMIERAVREKRILPRTRLMLHKHFLASREEAAKFSRKSLAAVIKDKAADAKMFYARGAANTAVDHAEIFETTPIDVAMEGMRVVMARQPELNRFDAMQVAIRENPKVAEVWKEAFAQNYNVNHGLE